MYTMLQIVKQAIYLNVIALPCDHAFRTDEREVKLYGGDIAWFERKMLLCLDSEKKPFVPFSETGRQSPFSLAAEDVILKVWHNPTNSEN